MMKARRPRSGTRTPDTEGPKGASSSAIVVTVMSDAISAAGLATFLGGAGHGAAARRTHRACVAGGSRAKEIQEKDGEKNADAAADSENTTPTAGPPPTHVVTLRLGASTAAHVICASAAILVGQGTGICSVLTGSARWTAGSPPPTRPIERNPTSATPHPSW
jgi:hypothetical protein